MGSWYENLKRMKKPDWVVIKPEGKGKLRVRLQYNNPKLGTKEIIIDEEVSFCLKGINVNVERGERWGDWGGAIKVGNVIYVSKRDKLLKDTKPVKVEFT
jgi:hypothetical protein